ncbi:hypothetical protein ACJQWK_06625 [Exserohilum turcicum]
MEVTPVTFRTYRAIFMRTSVPKAIPHLVMDFCTRHGLHSKLAMVFMIYAMVFTLIYPTLAGAMAGYKANVVAFVNTTNGNLVPFASMDYAFFVIHDGERIGQGGDYLVTDSAVPDAFSSGQPTVFKTSIGTTKCFSTRAPGYQAEDCYVQSNVSSYVSKYGLNGKSNVNSTFMGIDLAPPVLNISTFYLSSDASTNALLLTPKQNTAATTTTKPAFADVAQLRWAYANTTYTRAAISERGTCQAVPNYQWGFAFVQLFVVLVLSVVWSVGIYAMWLSAHSTMKRRGRTHVAGDHVAVLELADAMRSQGVHDTHTDTYEGKAKGDVTTTASTTSVQTTPAFTEEALRHRVTVELRGGSISYAAPLLSHGEAAREWGGVPTWLNRHKWSILGMLVCIGASVTSAVMLARDIMILIPLPLQLGTALYIGSTRGSRAVVLYWAILLFGIIPQVVAIVLLVTYRKG